LTHSGADLRLALIHSPLVGPSARRPTAGALQDRGLNALAVDYGGVSGPDWYGGATSRIAEALSGDDPLVLVAHSGAGGFIPGLVDAMGSRVAGFVLVDAVMPYPGRRWLDTAPPALVERVSELAEDGVLPPWDVWFGRKPIARLLSDPALSAEFSADLPRVPFAYLQAIAPDADAWRSRPAGYVQLSDGYAAEAAEAEALGWPVRREALHHLAMLTHPARVAAVLSEMTRELAET
jgi:hypothetical protein